MALYRNVNTSNAARPGSYSTTVSIFDDDELVAPDVNQINLKGSAVEKVEYMDGVLELTLNGSAIADFGLNNLNDVTLLTNLNGQALVYNSATSMWENKTIQTGGGGSGPDNHRDNGLIDIALSATEVPEESSGTETITVTLTAPDGYTVQSVEPTVTDPNSKNIDVTEVTENVVYTFPVDKTIIGVNQVSFIIHFYQNDDMDTVFLENDTATVTVDQQLYIAQSTAQPANVDNMTAQGVFPHYTQKEVTFTTAGSSGSDVKKAYLAVPYKFPNKYDYVYDFKLEGAGFTMDTMAIGQLSQSADYYLYELLDFDDTQTAGEKLIVTVQEAANG